MILLNFILVMVVVLVIFYIGDIVGSKSTENFNPNLAWINSYSYEPVDYNTRIQNCNELTYNPDKCDVDTVIPPVVNVCGETLTPITNNEKEVRKNKKQLEKKNPTLSLEYDFDLLSSFNNAQIDNINKNNINKSNNGPNRKQQKQYNIDDLMTEVRSLNSLENDLISNY